MRNIDLTEQAEKLKKKNELKINRETKNKPICRVSFVL